MKINSFRLLTTRLTKAVYSRLPKTFTTRLEEIVSPLTFRWFTRGIISANPALGAPPFYPVSIVIPSYNDFHLLTPLIKSLHKTLKSFEYEVIISDDYCQYENSEKLKTLVDSKVRVIFCDKRTGFAGAVNRGIQVAKFDVVLLNSDIIALDFWLENLQAAAYNFDSKIGLVSPHLLYPTGRIQYGGTFHASTIAPQWFAHLDQGRFANDKWANIGKYVAAISGACVYIKREVLQALGGLDDGYWLGFEDVDLAFRARELGFRSYLEPSSKLVHLESATRGKVQGFKEYSSLRRFWDKWPKQISFNELKPKVDLFLSTDAPSSLKLVRDNIEKKLVSFGVDVQKQDVLSHLRVDEHAVSLVSSKTSYKVALDKASIETVWLASEQSGIPVLYLISLQECGIDIYAPEDRALMKPEFTLLFGNPVDSAIVDSLVPWEIEKPISPPSFSTSFNSEKIATAGNNSSVRIISADIDFTEKLIKELSSGSNTFSVSSESDLILDLTSREEFPFEEIIVFGQPFSNSSIPLTLMKNQILFISPFSDSTKDQVLDGFNTFSYNKGDYFRAKYLLENLIRDKTTQQSLRLNGIKTVEAVENCFAKDLMSGLESRRSDVLPFTKSN